MMTDAPMTLFILRLLLAGVLGLLIGIERQWHQGLAGMRTNAMVATAACAFVSLPTLVPEDGTGPAHMANFIVTGIGFLGGGVILREGTSIRGLNTAATMWATAAVGAMIGCGLFLHPTLLAAFILVINVLLRPLVVMVNRLAARYGGGSAMSYLVELTCDGGNASTIRKRLLDNLDRRHLALRSVESRDGDNMTCTISAEIMAYGPDDARIESLVAGMSCESDVTSARWSLQTSAEADPRVHAGS